VLVCDVGGGTSDFSLIRVARSGDLVDFTRTAVGKHLLLGGDNLDLTLAWLVETKLGASSPFASAAACAASARPPRSGCSTTPSGRACRDHRARLRLVADRQRSLKTEILREEALELALDGFLPFTEPGEAPKEEKRSLFRELGLPYVTDPAITRHLNAFLEPLGRRPTPSCSTAASSFRRFCASAWPTWWSRWYGRRPEILENSELDLAVARGAAYYSYVRSTGSGVLVRGGLPRTYYIALGEPRDGKFPAVCLVPRGDRRRRGHRDR
jgi:hypothetical protein